MWVPMGRGGCRGCGSKPARPRHAHGDLTCLAPHERLPEVLIMPREKTPMGAVKKYPRN